MSSIVARGLNKRFGRTLALDHVDLTVAEGRIVGLIGPNGAGKSTLLQAILGLIPHEGRLDVLGRDPWIRRDELMAEVSFIADVAVLPRWLKVCDALDYMGGVHPRFDRARAEAFLARTTIGRDSRVRTLSKGMVAQLHLALVMATDARLLVLDEPTLGLDLLYRKQVFDTLLNDYFDHSRTIVVSTHQVDEVEHILTDVVFLDRGRVVLAAAMDELEHRYHEVVVTPDRLVAARELGPICERRLLGRSILLFERNDPERLVTLGEVRRPGLADLFVATVGARGAAEHKDVAA